MKVGKVLNPLMLRRSMGLVGLMGLGAACLWLLPSPPFSAVFAASAALSGITHLAGWLLFPRYKDEHLFYISLTWFNVALLALVVMDTGGMSSPFIFLYFWVIISEAMYGIEDRWVPLFASACYLLSVCCDAHGVFGVAPTLPGAAYPDVVYWLVAVLNCIYIVLAGMSSRMIIGAVLAKLAAENEQKEGLLKKFSELEASAHMGALAHHIAHNLRGPLAGISGYLQIEMLKKHSPELIDMFRDIDATVTTMAASLSALSKFGKSSVPAERVLLAEFFRQILAVASFAPLARGVTFARNFQDKLDVSVFASRSDLQQAYFNILKNALEAISDNSAGKTVEIEIRAEGGDAVVVISDNGPGMPADLLQNAFRRPLTTKEDGTGVGLIVTRNLFVRYSGDIQFFNRPEGGLSVITRLPLAS